MELGTIVDIGKPVFITCMGIIGLSLTPCHLQTGPNNQSHCRVHRRANVRRLLTGFYYILDSVVAKEQTSQLRERESYCFAKSLAASMPALDSSVSEHLSSFVGQHFRFRSH